MIRLIFSAEITTESVQNLINELSNIFSSFEGIEVEIYFTSNGGCCVAGEALLNTLNFFKDSVSIVAGYYIGSIAWDVFLKFDGYKRLSKYFSHAAIHCPSASLGFRELTQKYSEDTVRYEFLQNLRKSFIEDCAEYMHDSELNALIAGGDVILDRDRVTEILGLDVQE